MTTIDKKERIVRAMARLEAYHLVQNAMGRMIVALDFRQPEKVLAAFDLDSEGVSFEYADEGRFVGREAVTALVHLLIGAPPQPGEMRDLQLTTPIIEVADDGGSARAVWWVPGAGAIIRDDGEPDAIWDWGAIAADFVDVAGEWKIWHLHYFRYITCLYDEGWTRDTSLIHRPNTPMHPLAKPTTFHNPYSPSSVRDGIPAAPRPYATADGSAWMLSRDKEG